MGIEVCILQHSRQDVGSQETARDKVRFRRNLCNPSSPNEKGAPRSEHPRAAVSSGAFSGRRSSTVLLTGTLAKLRICTLPRAVSGASRVGSHPTG